MLIDVHCHVNLYMVLDEILQEAKNAGVEKVLAVGMSYLSQERIIEISESYEMIYPALGIHPEEANENPHIEKQLDSVIEYIRNNNKTVCAIGEIGLDHYFVKNKDVYPLQRKIFECMLTLAQELELPVNLHTKGAEKEIFDLLPSYNIPNINIHWYSGPENLLKVCIERGYYFSITPAISYSPASEKVVSMVNIDHLLLESDGPVEFRGKTSTPAIVRSVLNSISKIKGYDPEELEEILIENTKNIFPKLF